VQGRASSRVVIAATRCSMATTTRHSPIYRCRSTWGCRPCQKNLLRGTLLPPGDTFQLPQALVHAAIERAKGGNTFPPETLFARRYDLVVPLPSSQGPRASPPNVDNVPRVDHALLRTVPMATKSTKLYRGDRIARDAPRLIHFGTMHVDGDDRVRGARILLWDDVITCGNTSEAARNLLLLAGAHCVDLLTAFSSHSMSDMTGTIIAWPLSNAFKKT
jgi:hypothetical protein